jgi:hypothetical protein
VDKPNTKIAISELEKLELLLDDAPAHQATVVTKREAIVRLAPRLHDLHGKGYSWRGVAAWLAEHGLNVSTSVLGEYLRGAAVTSPRRGFRPTKGRRPDGSRTSDLARPTPDPLHDSLIQAEAPSMSSSGSPASAKQPTVRLVPASAHAAARRSDFTVRPDSDDI